MKFDLMNYLIFSRKWNVDQVDYGFEQIADQDLSKNLADVAQVIYDEIKKSQLLPVSQNDHLIAHESKPLNKNRGAKDDVA